MDKKIKIIFILPSLKAGGAERVISFVATHLNPKKFESILVVIGKSEDAVYKTEGIEVRFLNKSRVLNAIPLLFKYILFAKPDIVVGSIAHVNKVIALFSIVLSKIKFVAREAGVLSVMNTYGTAKPKILTTFLRNYHKYLDKVICQSNDMLNDIKKNIAIDESKLVVINNPITDGFSLENHAIYDKSEVIKYITVGSLHERKGHIRLLHVLKKVDHPFHYTIVGNGEELDAIMETIEKLELKDKITHVPYTSEVSQYLRENNVFLNGSFVEGFPNAILESCAVGTPVVSFAAPGGINEIIVAGVNGFIANSEEHYVQTLNTINKDYKFKSEIVNESVTSRYSKTHILTKYESVFENLVKE